MDLKNREEKPLFDIKRELGDSVFDRVAVYREAYKQYKEASHVLHTVQESLERVYEDYLIVNNPNISETECKRITWRLIQAIEEDVKKELGE